MLLYQTQGGATMTIRNNYFAGGILSLALLAARPRSGQLHSSLSLQRLRIAALSSPTLGGSNRRTFLEECFRHADHCSSSAESLVKIRPESGMKLISKPDITVDYDDSGPL